jgi:hypothetical protein
MAYTVEDFLVEQAPMIGTDINQKMMEQPTPWINLYKQETWEDEKSSTQKTFQFDRAKLTDPTGTLSDELIEEVEWADVATDVSLNNNTANHQSTNGDGIPPADNVEFTQTLREYNLQHKAVWGPPMNTNQLRNKFVRAQQMGACVVALADQAREFWIERKRSEYTRIADNLIVLDSGFSLAGGYYGDMAAPATTGTDQSILTTSFCDEIYEYLNLHGAGKGSMGVAENRPVYGLVTSSRQSRRLIMADPDVREDFRYSSQNEKLLAPMGIKWTYNGFTHIIDDKTDRWESVPASAVTIAVDAATSVATFSAPLVDSNGATVRLYKGSTITVTGADACKLIVIGRHATANKYYVKSAVDSVALIDVTPAVTTFTAWAKVPQFIVTTVNGVLKRVPNPLWLTATWEDSQVFHQDVCCSLIPKPITSVGQASFDAIKYNGTYRWTNYDDRQDNPDGQIGQFRGVLSNGTRPENPEFGIIIRHLAVPRPAGRIVGEASLG